MNAIRLVVWLFATPDERPAVPAFTTQTRATPSVARDAARYAPRRQRCCRFGSLAQREPPFRYARRRAAYAKDTAARWCALKRFYADAQR